MTFSNALLLSASIVAGATIVNGAVSSQPDSTSHAGVSLVFHGPSSRAYQAFGSSIRLCDRVTGDATSIKDERVDCTPWTDANGEYRDRP